MLAELRKSINSILYERVTSPLFGTLLLSWIAWNWKIAYLTFFISENHIQGTKIDYILNNYCQPCNLYVYPLISTIVLLTIIPFASNGTFWLSLKFKKWRIDQKNKIEQQQLLTVEQSIKLREEIVNQENKFQSLLEDKNSEIIQQKAVIEELQKRTQSFP